MRDEAIKTARKFLTEVPSRDEESLNEYIRNGKKAKSELKAYLNQAAIGGKTAANGQDYLEANGLIQEIDEKTSAGDLILQRVRFETPQDTVTASGDETEIDWESTINRLAVLTASETYSMPSFDRLYYAEDGYRTHIEPKLAGLGDELETYAKARYDEKIEEMFSLSGPQLKEAVDKEFPTEDWIGPDSAPLPDGSDHVKSDYEVNDDEADANTQGSDSTFEKMIDDERKHRGINKASRKTAKVSRYVKIADEIDGADDAGVEDLLGETLPLDSVSEEGGERTVWVQYNDELIGFSDSDVTELQVVPESAVQTKEDFGDAATGDSSSSSSDSSSDSSSSSDSGSSDNPFESSSESGDSDEDKKENPFEEKESKRKRAEGERSGPGYCPNCGGTNVTMRGNESLRQWSQQGGGSTTSNCKDCGEVWTIQSKDRERQSGRKNAVEDRSDVKQVGEGEGDPKHPEQTMEERFENSPSGGAPRGPNRRKSEDVPAYSSDAGKLTSPQKSSKLSAALELKNRYGMDEDTAYKVATLLRGANYKEAVKRLKTKYTVSDDNANKIARVVVGDDSPLGRGGFAYDEAYPKPGENTDPGAHRDNPNFQTDVSHYDNGIADANAGLPPRDQSNFANEFQYKGYMQGYDDGSV